MFTTLEIMRESAPRGFGSHNRMRRNSVLFTIIFLTLAGCSSKERITDPVSNSPTLNDYVPLKVGNSWTYSGFNVNNAASRDTSSSSPVVITIIQTNLLIGGQPNAFIVQSDDEHGQASNLAFSIIGNTIWHYLGAGSTFHIDDSLILWVPGGIGGAVVGVNQTQKYYVRDRSGNSILFSIIRPPDPSIALATTTSQDTVQIKGVSAGETAFTLQRVDGTAADTMIVLIGVRSNVPSSVTSPFPPWAPLWQFTNSTSNETVFSLDTTYSFKCISDTAECRDELHYLFTNRYVGDEVLPALNMTLHCDRFEMKITITETITYTDTIRTRVLFSGLSTYYTIDTWLAKGIGFVKGRVNGSSLSPVASMGGFQDSSGVLKGYYISPRVTYASIPTSLTSYRQFFQVDDLPLSGSSVYNEFILVRKNF